MKQLIILRHAKTEATAADDWHRNLTDRGRAQAQSLAPTIAALNLNGLVVYTSTALRAMQTWEEIAPALGSDVDVRPTNDLYVFDAEDVLQVIREVDDSVNSLMIVGHNPGLSYLTSMVCGEGLPNDRAVAKNGELRTCRGVLLEYDGQWSELYLEDCGVAAYLSPTVD
ncbi:SixA phosphatase family protein [Cumulibacter soli]|uniref:SixA phosphatase family protein n=1 Tax=Cumulibacter soli TaxID=2546344 RepID=UPI0010686A74|nr:histidine phosphatase family protein [Cumulibacter soli]